MAVYFDAVRLDIVGRRGLLSLGYVAPKAWGLAAIDPDIRFLGFLGIPDSSGGIVVSDNDTS